MNIAGTIISNARFVEHRDADGVLERIDVEWAESDATHTMISRAMIDVLAERTVEVSRLRAERDRLRELVGEAIDAGARNDEDRIAEIHREAGQ